MSVPAPDRRRTDSFAVGVVSSPRYFPQVEVLATSLLDRHPDVRVALLRIGETDREFDGRIEVLRPEDIGVDSRELDRMGLMYTMQGLAGSMKVRLLQHLIGEDEGEDAALLLDADICVYGDLSPVAKLAREHGLVLSPGLETPGGIGDHFGFERATFVAGMNTSGFVAVGRQGRPFLDWWAERTRRHCVFDPGRGIFFEQVWLGIAPALFPHHFLKDRVSHVTPFTLHDRDVEWRGGRPLIGSEPLGSFHFCGPFNVNRPERLTTDDFLRSFWPSMTERPGAVRLARDYADRVEAAGIRDAQGRSMPFQALPDGSAIQPAMREAYRMGVLDAEIGGELPEPPNPFTDGDVRRFREWLDEHVSTVWGSGTRLELAADSVNATNALNYLNIAEVGSGAD
jgi:hypothetical protein